MVDYDHDLNSHGLKGPRAALPKLIDVARVQSLLDVGCGRGHWIAAARELGIQNVFGIDGADIKQEQLLFPSDLFQQRDLEVPFDLGRRFDVVLCLEVAEHLAPDASHILIESLVRHSDTVIFSAAVPGQPGQHHVHCQWPDYWQGLFNGLGYRCDDRVRWALWRNTLIEVWYRQNIFIAYRDEEGAKREERLAAVLHPEMLHHMQGVSLARMHANLGRSVERGSMSVAWYWKIALSGPTSKILRKAGLLRYLHHRPNQE